MTHYIDINNVHAIEVGPIFPDLLAAHESKRHSRRIIVRTQFGATTIVLHAASPSHLEVSEVPVSWPPDGRSRTGASPAPKAKR